MTGPGFIDAKGVGAGDGGKQQKDGYERNLLSLSCFMSISSTICVGSWLKPSQLSRHRGEIGQRC